MLMLRVTVVCERIQRVVRAPCCRSRHVSRHVGKHHRRLLTTNDKGPCIAKPFKQAAGESYKAEPLALTQSQRQRCATMRSGKPVWRHRGTCLAVPFHRAANVAHLPVRFMSRQQRDEGRVEHEMGAESLWRQALFAPRWRP